MPYPTTPRTILKKRYPHLHDQQQGFGGADSHDDSAASINLHLNTRLSYVLGQSRAAPHRRVSNVIHRYGLLLGESIPRLREQFSELELSILTWVIAEANTEHMNSRTFIGLMGNMVRQRREEGQLSKVPEDELDALEDKLVTLSLLEELALLDLVEQRLAKGIA